MSRLYKIEVEVEISLLGDELEIASIEVDGEYVRHYGERSTIYVPSHWSLPNKKVEDAIVKAAMKAALTDDWSSERGKLYSDYTKEG